MSSANIVSNVTKDHWATRAVVGILGLLAAGVLLYVSATMNYRFGYSMGKTPDDAQLYGMFSAAADTLKVLMPFMAFWGFRQKVYPVAWGGMVALLVCTLWGWTGAAGHLASNRLDVTGQRAVKADSYKDLRADKARFAKELETWTAAVNRPANAIKDEIDGAKFGKMWTTTSGCSVDVVTRDRREFCQNIKKLEADLGTAMKREEYARKLEEVSAKLEKATADANAGTVGATEADPQAGILSRLSNGIIGVPMWQVILAILGVAVLEAGGGLIPFVTWTYMVGASVQRQKIEEAELVPATAPTTATPKIPALQAVASAPLALAGPAAGNVLPLPQTAAPGKGVGEAGAAPAPATAKDKVATATSLAPRNPFLGKPAPGSEAELRSIQFPVDGRVPSKPRRKLALKDAGENFVKGLQAFGVKEFWSDEPHPEAISKLWLGELYAQWSEAYHTEMCRLEDIRATLKKTRGIEHKDRVRIDPDPDKRDEAKRRNQFVVAGRRYPKAEDPAPPGGGAGEKRPFSVASSVAANDTAPRRFAVVPTRSFQPDHERWAIPAQIAEARRIKAEQRGQMRQMRRTQHRWAA